MAKRPAICFLDELELLLVKAWGQSNDHLTDHLVAKTRESILRIRDVYRQHSQPVARLRFEQQQNRAGYLGAFGERHAYLAYEHLVRVASSRPDLIPQPGPRGELTVTLVGAGAAIELFGLLLYYNQGSSQSVRRLRVNLIDKVRNWVPVQQHVIGSLLQRAFPRVDIDPVTITVDLTHEHSHEELHKHFERLTTSDLVLVYNTLNEIEERHADRVWRSLRYFLALNTKPALIMIAEPSAPKMRPRMTWLADQLARMGTTAHQSAREVIRFDHPPVEIEFTGLNKRLFTVQRGQSSPTYTSTMSRFLLASHLDPEKAISMSLQIEQAGWRRARRPDGKFRSPAIWRPGQSEGQLAMPDLVNEASTDSEGARSRS